MKHTRECQVSKKFNQRAENYDMEGVDALRRRFIKRISSETSPNPKGTAVDIGTGTGALATHLSKKYKSVIAIDISRKMLKVAVAKAKSKGIDNVEFRVGGFLKPRINKNSIDLITSSLAFHHLTDKEKEDAIRIMRKILKKNGKIVIGDVMFFFDRKSNTRMMSFVKTYIKKIASSQASDLIGDLDNEYLSKADDIRLLFERNGFTTRTIMLFPILGIIVAVPKGD
jgi:putative AdoMet-dependent methyltransferase